MRMYTNKKGFTLLEILLVVAALAILAGIVILAINPGKQLGDTRDAQRSADVSTIINAVYQYAIDNNGDLPGDGDVVGPPVADFITTTPTPICLEGSASACEASGTVWLDDLTENGTYIVAIPTDPSGSDADQAGYEISKDANGRITVSAPDAENTTVSVTR